jgi:hypothetical protein
VTATEKCTHSKKSQGQVRASFLLFLLFLFHPGS